MEKYLADINYRDIKILDSITHGEYKDTAFQYTCIVDDLNKLPLFVDSIIDANGENIINKIKEQFPGHNLMDEKTKEYLNKLIPENNIIKTCYIENMNQFKTKGPYVIIAYNIVLQHSAHDSFAIKYC